MRRIRRGDYHRFNAVRCDQRLRVGKDGGARRGGLRAGGVGVKNACEMRAGRLAPEKARMFGSHHARSDDTDADAHFIAPFGVLVRQYASFIGASGTGITPGAAPTPACPNWPTPPALR